MRKVIVSEFVSLDGVSEAPQQWAPPFWNDEIAQLKYDELFAADLLLLGRATYQFFAESGPIQTDDAYVDRMNRLPKVVISTTLEAADWNNSILIKKNVVQEISRLKQVPGQDILIPGSTRLVQSLIPHNIIDEYRLLICPVVLGRGKRLFSDKSNITLKLAETNTFGSGVVLLAYKPVTPP
ncbi:MAG: dihydrofolate reductase family protein [Anaerolineae bacterium]|nr:dihydrofolate reductase family protein [Anaerolineae bacterium]